MDRARFHSMARFLKKKRQFVEPLHTLIKKVPRRRDGDCTYDGTRYMIRVAPYLDTNEAIGTLLHEMAHAVSWGLDGPDETDDHGDFFKHAERTVWGWYLDWLRGE